MSASSTISNLQQALTCAGKCDCCSQLNQKINQLQQQVDTLKNQSSSQKQQIDKLNNRINNLERYLGGSKQQPPNTSLTAVYARLARLEDYINKLDKAGQRIKALIPEIQKELTEFIKMLVEAWLTNFITGK